ncbi:hypothetical protein ABZ345_34070 [Lentzea sp. NPDC005914]|uniref:hypothetical protein n=1 Tax=Lentzea sp. NPDC005914 TaxID=3154572 RepID=UPI0033D6505E
MGLPQIDVLIASPSMSFIRSGAAVEPHIDAALDEFFVTTTAHNAAREAAQAGRVDMVPPDADAELVARLILDARERKATPDRAREALFGVLNAHYGDWTVASNKQVGVARAKLIKLLGQVIELTAAYHVHSGTAQGLAERARFQFRGYAGQNLVQEAHTSAEAFLEHLRLADAADRQQPDAAAS